MVDNLGTFVPTGQKLRAFLFAAENIADQGQPMQLVPRERASGVPEFYLLHVTPELEPPTNLALMGHAVQLDGVDDSITVAPASSLDLVRTATVELWFKVDVSQNADGTLEFGVGKNWMPIVYKGDAGSPSSAARTYSLWLNRGGFLHFTSANGTFQDGVVNTPNFSVKAGQWYHFAGVMDRNSGAMRAYLNGNLVATGSVGTSDARSTAASALRFGQTFESSPDYTPFLGTLDEIRIWNTARPEADILHDFERILVGDDAHALDKAVRADPEAAYSGLSLGTVTDALAGQDSASS